MSALEKHHKVIIKYIYRKTTCYRGSFIEKKERDANVFGLRERYFLNSGKGTVLYDNLKGDLLRSRLRTKEG